MASVMIGVDPHKASHTAVAISGAEEPLGSCGCAPAPRRPSGCWSGPRPGRSGPGRSRGRRPGAPAGPAAAVGGRAGAGRAAQAGRAGAAAGSGNVNKNDPNDARSVAVAALRSPGVREARPDDHAAVLKVWSKRRRDLASARTQVVCRLHAVLCELVPGGVAKKIIAAHAARLLDSITPPDAVAAARWELAAALIEDLRRIDAQLRETRKKLDTAVRASGTSLTGLFGVGPVIAATIIGEVRDVSRFKNRDRFAACNGTAPIEVSSGRPQGPPAVAGAGTAGSTTPSTWPPSPRSASPTARAAPTTTRNWPRARPTGRPCARSSGRSATPSSPASATDARRAQAQVRDPGGQ